MDPSSFAVPFRIIHRISTLPLFETQRKWVHIYAGALLQSGAQPNLSSRKISTATLPSPPVSNSVSPAIFIPSLFFSSVSHWPPPPPARLYRPCRLPKYHLLLPYNCALRRRVAPYSCLACSSPSKIYLTPPSHKLPTCTPLPAYNCCFRFPYRIPSSLLLHGISTRDR